VIIFFNFRYLAIVVDEYCAEGITKISEWLNFSQSLAGVTLLAFANGAGDVLTAIVASGSSEGVFYNIGSIYGAGLFVCCCVVGVAIFKQEEGGIQFDEMIIKRDISIYIITTVTIIIFGIIGKITWISSVILLLIYACQVMFVLWQDSKEEDGNVTTDSLKFELLELDDSKIDNQKTRIQNEINQSKQSALTAPKSNKFWGKLRKQYVKKDNPLKKKATNVFSLTGIRNLLKQYKKTQKLVAEAKGEEPPHEEHEDSGIFWKIVDYPFHIIAYFTLLPSEEEHYSRLRSLCYSFTGTGFMFFVMYHFEWTTTVFFTWLVIALIHFSLFLIILPRDGSLPKLGAQQWITVNGVVSATFWMYFMIELLISLLNAVGMVFDLEASFLGFTVLAIGNALPDALSTFALFEKEGQAVMALSGAYNGQLFGLLIGFGLGNLKMTLNMGPQTFRLFDPAEFSTHLIGIIVIMVAFTTLTFTWLWAFFNKFWMNRTFAYTLIAIYAVFLVGATAYSLL
jgi:sodium/potassium/calcium exchanger 6